MAFSLDSRRTVGRRGFLFGLGSMGVVAGSALAGRRAGTSTGTHARADITLLPDVPFAFLSTDVVEQTQAFSIHVHGYYADTATATFNGTPVPLVSDGTYLVGIFGAGQAVNDPTEIDPGDYSVHVDAAVTGMRPYGFDLPISVVPHAFTADYVQLPPALTGLLDPSVAQKELVSLVSTYGVAQGPPLWLGLLLWPVVGPITTQFGEERSYNGGPLAGHHSGVDIAADMGSPASAAAPGRVAFTGPLSERGNFVAIDHGLGVYTGYAHLSKISVAVGQSVTPRDVIGLIGTTGLSTGPHLHWECAVNGVHVDAMRWTRELLP